MYIYMCMYIYIYKFYTNIARCMEPTYGIHYLTDYWDELCKDNVGHLNCISNISSLILTNDLYGLQYVESLLRSMVRN